ncbi:MAG: ribonuclease activity regulator RraA [Alphaproteobacteria bacterium]|nr:ribonuclease activity regulator RraA [Alphaproteobacteria bacterium]
MTRFSCPVTPQLHPSEVPLSYTPISPETRERLSRVSTATISTQLYRRGFRQRFMVGLKPLSTEAKGFVGHAFTMRHIPMREDIDDGRALPNDKSLQWQAVESVGPGEAIVIDSMNDITAASMGDMLVTRTMMRGAAGVVTDGAFRDGPVIAGLGFPAYARAMTATTRPATFHVADIQVPIGCAGVAVYPGDVVVGDREGVIVIPRHLAEEVAEKALAQEELEDWLHKKVRGGAALWGVYPPNAETIAEYKAWREANKGKAS